MSDFPEKAEDKVNTLAIVAIGLATTALLWASVIALQAYFETTHGEVVAERKAVGLTAGIRNLDAQQMDDLNTTTYADPKLGTLKRLSIANAKKAVIESANKKTSLIPSLGELNKATILTVPGVGQAIPAEEIVPTEAAADCDESTCLVDPTGPCCNQEAAGDAASAAPSEPAQAPATPEDTPASE